MSLEKKNIAKKDLKPAKESRTLSEIVSITEGGNTVEALQKNLKEASYYKYALEQSAIVAITDQKGIITYANDNFCKISKYSREELIGQDHRIINSGYHPKEFIRNLWVTIANGKIWKGELKNKAKDGSVYWVDTTIVPFLNEQGKPYQYVAIRADITHRKAAEESLEKSLKEVSDYKYALEQSAIVAITDQKGIILYANNNFCKISKYSREELIGQDHRIINSGHHPKEFIRNLWVTIANGKIWRGELKNKAKDGTVYWVDTTIVPFLNEQGKPYQYVAIRADITQRKQAEEEIRTMNEELEKKVEDRTLMLRETLIQLESSKNELAESLEKEKELSELKTRFVSTVSHEFRTPLASVLSSAALIGKYTKEDDQPKRDRHVARIKEAVKHLSMMLEDLLSLGKLEEGLIEAKTDVVHFAAFMEDFLSEMKELLKPGQQIKFTQSGNDEIVTDKRLVKNILLNLVSNAVKFSPEDSVIEITCSNNGKQAVMSVKDSGIGISKEDQQHLFERFFRARNASNIQGTGLGLHIVSKYIELLNGEIKLHSEEDKGTTFTITIPSK